MGEIALSVELGDRAQLVAVNSGLLQFAVDLLAHPAVTSVDQVLDDGAVGECHLAQVGGGVVVVSGGTGCIRSGLALTGDSAGIGDVAVLEQAVLVVVVGHRDHSAGAGVLHAIAVVVVDVAILYAAQY